MSRDAVGCRRYLKANPLLVVLNSTTEHRAIEEHLGNILPHRVLKTINLIGECSTNELGTKNFRNAWSLSVSTWHFRFTWRTYDLADLPPPERRFSERRPISVKPCETSLLSFENNLEGGARICGAISLSAQGTCCQDVWSYIRHVTIKQEATTTNTRKDAARWIGSEHGLIFFLSSFVKIWALKIERDAQAASGRARCLWRATPEFASSSRSTIPIAKPTTL